MNMTSIGWLNQMQSEGWKNKLADRANAGAAGIAQMLPIIAV